MSTNQFFTANQLGSTSGLFDNGDGSFSHSDGNGNVTGFDAKISTVADNGDGSFDLMDDFGAVVTVALDDMWANMSPADQDAFIAALALSADAIAYDNSTSGSAATDVQAALDGLFSQMSGLSTDNITQNADGSYTHTAVDGSATTITFGADAVSFDDSTANLGESDVQGAIEVLDDRLDRSEKLRITSIITADTTLTGPGDRLAVVDTSGGPVTLTLTGFAEDDQVEITDGSGTPIGQPMANPLTINPGANTFIGLTAGQLAADPMTEGFGAFRVELVASDFKRRA